MRGAAVVLLCGAAAAQHPHHRTCKVGPKVSLVSVNKSYSEVSKVPGFKFERDDFESIEHDRVVLWATEDHLAALGRAGHKMDAAEDVGAASFAAEKLRNYKDTAGAEPEWDQYCGHACLTERLAEMAATGGCQFPFELEKIGETVNGYDIWAARIGSTGPEVLMAANIHGDETTGGQLFQRWMWETCHQPSAEQREVALAVRAWYVPLFNVDGYENNRRCNGNGRDPNRNFPLVTGGGQTLEPEARSLIAFEDRHSFSLSIMMHGGAVVCNTVYDNCYTSDIVPRPCPEANPTGGRSAGILPSSKAYCDAMLAEGVRCTVGSGCQINGAAWYQITGSVQDYEYHFKDTLSMTMEVSSTKRPSASQLPTFYRQNYQAIHDYMMWAVNNPRV